jgi:hypothetical protein
MALVARVIKSQHALVAGVIKSQQALFAHVLKSQEALVDGVLKSQQALVARILKSQRALVACVLKSQQALVAGVLESHQREDHHMQIYRQYVHLVNDFECIMNLLTITIREGNPKNLRHSLNGRPCIFSRLHSH